MNARIARLPALVALGIGLTLALSGCERPPTETVQRGYRGVGMVQVYNPRTLAAQADGNAVPEALPAAAEGTPKASTVFKNVQVLGDLDSAQFTRVMTAMTQWVAPQQGCAYCHEGNDLASDKLYTKVVARRMLQMTRDINSHWKTHVADTGVTCFTCHRGQPVPAQVWFQEPGPKTAQGPAGNRMGQNVPTMTVGLTSLPYDPFTAFLRDKGEIRVATPAPLPAGNPRNIQQTEGTYALMMHMSQSLGVNCTYCHNSRSFAAWESSTPQRAVAWHGIRMVRELNTGYLEPLAGSFPPQRLGPLGDGPKANCGTCHQGAFKPLYGAGMLKDYPELLGDPAAKPSSAATSAGDAQIARASDSKQQ